MMSLCSLEDRVIICSENISNDYEITTSEILSHANKLGVDCKTESHFLPIVLKGLVHPLPADWIPCYDKQLKQFFYYNSKSGISQWEHPIDKHYRDILSKIRKGHGANLEEFLHEKENLDMLPLRQNRKPQLLPIKQLLKYKDEERSAVGGKMLKSDLHSSLKEKSDSSPLYKKSVSFITNEPTTDNGLRFLSGESENRVAKISNNRDNFNSETIDPWERGDDFRNSDDEDRCSSDDDSKLEITPLSKNLNRKINSLKQSFNKIKSNADAQPANNFKRLHINLRQPDSLLFSDSNHDDTIKNIPSASPSSELISEEDESPHNALTNLTESGIDVNTVTDLQKLKAKSKLSNQSSNDVDKQVSRVIDMSLRAAVVKIEHSLNAKFEAKIAEEIIKLKEFYKNNLKSNFNSSDLESVKQNSYEIVKNETEERFKIFQEEIGKEINQNRTALEEFRNTCNMEINKLEENFNKVANSTENKPDCTKNMENLQSQLQNLLEEKLNNMEQNLREKAENLELKYKSKMDEFKIENDKIMIKHHKEVQTFMENYHKNSEKLWLENSKIIVEHGLKGLSAEDRKSDDLVFHCIEKIVQKVLDEKLTRKDVDSTYKKTIATQTENAFIVARNDEIMELKKKITEISATLKQLIVGVGFSTRYKDLDEGTLTENAKKVEHPICAEIPLRVESYKTDFNPFEEFSLHIDEELERYRRKYLSNSKWLNIQTNKNV